MSARAVALGDAGLCLAVAERGAGEPLVYLHGVFDRVENPLTDALGSSHRVLAPDLPGFGASVGEAALEDVADGALALVGLADALGLGRVALVGHCLGAMLAAEAAALQPARFSPLVLLAPFGAWDDAEPGLDLFSATAAELESALLAGRPRPGALSGITAPGGPDLDGLDEQGALEARLARARALAGAARLLWPIPDRGLRRRAYRLPARTLVVLGEADTLCPPGPARALFSRAPGAAVVSLPGAGHLVHLVAPEQVATLVGDFLATSG